MAARSCPAGRRALEENDRICEMLTVGSINRETQRQHTAAGDPYMEMLLCPLYLKRRDANLLPEWLCLVLQHSLVEAPT